MFASRALDDCKPLQLLPEDSELERSPKHVVKKGKTPVLSAEEARGLLDRIDLSTLAGLRDRALIGVLVFSFARVSAVVSMWVADYYTQGRRCFFRLHEKGGWYNVVPAHHPSAISFPRAGDTANAPRWKE